jgi:hypothetical protein
MNAGIAAPAVIAENGKLAERAREIRSRLLPPLTRIAVKAGDTDRHPPLLALRRVRSIDLRPV